MVELGAHREDGEHGCADFDGRGLLHNLAVLDGGFVGIFVVGHHAGDDCEDGLFDVGVALCLDGFDGCLGVVEHVFIAQVFVGDFGGVAVGQCDLLAAKGDFFCDHSS